MLKAFVIPAAIIGLTAAPALAQSDENGETRAVSIAGIDLSTSEGQQLMERKVKVAVRQVCGTPYVADLSYLGTVRQCRNFAWSNARPQMDEAIVSYRRGRVELQEIALVRPKRP